MSDQRVQRLPIGLSVQALVLDRSEDAPRGEEVPEGSESRTEELTGRGTSYFAICLMLGIAYAASISPLATLIGTPPNLFMAGSPLWSIRWPTGCRVSA